MSRLLCTLLLGLLALNVSAQSLTASVDRTRLDAGESVELTLESDDATLFGKPDLQPLNELFEVLGTRQVNRLTSGSTGAQASTRWIITLQPKHSGYVVIPPLSLDQLQSAPITLHVQQASSADDSRLAPVFIDASLDQESVYVQAQTVLTLRIYHSVSLYDDSSLTQLDMPQARVEALGEPRTYEKDINGVRHGVIELRYAIFPQESGELLIPSQAFTATALDRSASNTYNPFGPRPGKVVRVRSPEIPLTVKAKPASYPADAPWLPARSLSLSEVWSPQPETARVGDSLTRSLLLKVEGLASAQLPPLPATQVAGLRRYPDQPQLANQASDNGLVASREEREALVANREGVIALPAIEVLWWNTTTDQLERSSLPARNLQVAANPNLETLPVEAARPAVSEAANVQLWPWQLSSALLSLTTLLGFTLWWRARRQPAVLPSQQTGPSPRNLLDDLKRSCLANDSQATRHALDAWARQQPETLADMAARFTPLSDALDGLNGALYSESGQHWQGRNLWLAIRSLPAVEDLESTTNPDTSALPPLYPR
ncbi:MAG: BatD family protein [Pseudomonas sp.]|uniref:BatD family protein n=1 Tax=Pseudomonas sp. TaxID=306 RepID=UPI00271ECE06|nr:BatD family protein [Pseudomonas sp.]MDO9616698.1 BatD family protein [Pseudomonas sp.]MDP2444283.1 BatD family protein [Pseudomonas sp.]MDZ4335401.1 BatD family protein [Pseudomonas sp.]